MLRTTHWSRLVHANHKVAALRDRDHRSDLPNPASQQGLQKGGRRKLV